MWIEHTFIVVLLFLILQLSSCSENMNPKALSSAVATFSAKFINELDKTKSSVSSPLSAEFVLALIALGTSGKAHEELLSSLGFPDDNTIRSAFTRVSSMLKSIKGVTLDVANKVYVMEGGYDLQAPIKEDAVNIFDAAFEIVNFAENVKAANIINSWVEGKTNKRIKDLIQPDDLNAYSRLVLVNAIYFKGTWKTKFDVNNTSNQPFYLSKSSTIDIPMMYREDNYKFGFSEELQAQLLQMDYIGDEASMLIVLPNEVDGLNTVLEKLAAGHNLMSDVEKMHSNKVRVTIPKFKIETEIDLGNLLPKLGIKSIFNENNSGLTKLLNADEPLYVSKAIQKAFIEVNEEGAEAAAATVGAVRMRRCAPQHHEFVANRPALWCILVGGQIMVGATYRPTETPRRDEL
ncbi:hypothetical protein ACJJTC_008103 [Scirpophaga incertulas]